MYSPNLFPTAFSSSKLIFIYRINFSFQLKFTFHLQFTFHFFNFPNIFFGLPAPPLPTLLKLANVWLWPDLSSILMNEQSDLYYLDSL